MPNLLTLIGQLAQLAIIVTIQWLVCKICGLLGLTLGHFLYLEFGACLNLIAFNKEIIQY
jgi:hypothetical protein